jgi:hypothetical protein
MGWNRQQFEARRKSSGVGKFQRVRVQLSAACCAECGCELGASHLIGLYGEMCRRCWKRFIDSFHLMASH